MAKSETFERQSFSDPERHGEIVSNETIITPTIEVRAALSLNKLL